MNEEIYKLLPEKKNAKPYGELIHLESVEGFNEAIGKCARLLEKHEASVDDIATKLATERVGRKVRTSTELAQALKTKFHIFKKEE